MHDRSEPATTQSAPPGQRADNGGIGFALFLILAGLILLAERMGWISQGMDWLFPVVLLAWGAGELYRRLGSR